MEKENKFKAWWKKNWKAVSIGASYVAGMCGLIVWTRHRAKIYGEEIKTIQNIQQFVADNWMDMWEVPYKDKTITVNQAKQLADFYEQSANEAVEELYGDNAPEFWGNFTYNYGVDHSPEWKNIENIVFDEGS